MSPGLNFQCLVGSSSRASSRSFWVVGRDVQHALDDRDPGAGQLGLEGVDRVVAALDLVLRGQLVHPDDQHVLVVAAVEDADAPLGRQRLADPPQEVVLQLLLGRRLERGDPHALGVDQADGVPEHAALPGGVHALQHQQHAPGRGRRRRRPRRRAAPGGRTGRRRAPAAPPCPSSLSPSKPGVSRRSGWPRGRRAPAGVGEVMDLNLTAAGPSRLSAGAGRSSAWSRWTAGHPS